VLAAAKGDDCLTLDLPLQKRKVDSSILSLTTIHQHGNPCT